MVDEGIKTFEVLLVEDSEADAELVKEAFNRGNRLINLNVVADGKEATTFLRGEGLYNNVLRPDLILLDLNLPKKSGLEILEEVKNDQNLCSIPIVILTSSASENDVSNAYRLHANCYLIKPLDFELFMQNIQQLSDFWFSLIVLPNKKNK